MTVQETSKIAFYSEVKPTLGARQLRVWEVLHTKPNMTNSEIAGMLDWPINTVTPRVFELRKAGLVEEDVKRECKVTGRTAIAWRVLRETLF